MKCISILQPWASLVVTKDPKTGKAYKQIETRSWNTKHRGPLLIHASKRWDRELNDTVGKIGADGILKIHGYHSEGIRNGKLITNLPLGAIIGMVNVVDTFPMETAGNVFQKMSDIGIKDQDQELAFGDYSADRYGWLLSDPIMFKNPIPCKGNLSIWNLPVELELAVLNELLEATGIMYGVLGDGSLTKLDSEYKPSLIASPGEGAVIVEGVKDCDCGSGMTTCWANDCLDPNRSQDHPTGLTLPESKLHLPSRGIVGHEKLIEDLRKSEIN